MPAFGALHRGGAFDLVILKPFKLKTLMQKVKRGITNRKTEKPKKDAKC
jgi:FixJ family two-component response regulator